MTTHIHIRLKFNIVEICQKIVDNLLNVSNHHVYQTTSTVMIHILSFMKYLPKYTLNKTDSRYSSSPVFISFTIQNPSYTSSGK